MPKEARALQKTPAHGGRSCLYLFAFNGFMLLLAAQSLKFWLNVP